jgi:hypothetical protein
MRDTVIVDKIRELHALGVVATRNRSRFDQAPYTSGCSMVAHALGLQEKAVEDIWGDRRLLDQGHRHTRARKSTRSA